MCRRAEYNWNTRYFNYGQTPPLGGIPSRDNAKTLNYQLVYGMTTQLKLNEQGQTSRNEGATRERSTTDTQPATSRCCEENNSGIKL